MNTRDRHNIDFFVLTFNDRMLIRMNMSPVGVCTNQSLDTDSAGGNPL